MCISAMQRTASPASLKALQGPLPGVMESKNRASERAELWSIITRTRTRDRAVSVSVEISIRGSRIANRFQRSRKQDTTTLHSLALLLFGSEIVRSAGLIRINQTLVQQLTTNDIPDLLFVLRITVRFGTVEIDHRAVSRTIESRGG